MDDLIEALQIFRKYSNEKCPTGCEHDTLLVYGVLVTSVSQSDKNHLKRLGFYPGNPLIDGYDGEDLIVDGECDTWHSFRFGSA